MTDASQIPTAPTADVLPKNKKTVVARKRRTAGKALGEIKKYQISDKHVVPRESIRRFIAETVQSLKADYRISASAVDALRTASEAAIAQAFGLAAAMSNELAKKDTVDLASFRAAVNILNSDHLFSTAGISSGALTAPLV